MRGDQLVGHGQHESEGKLSDRNAGGVGRVVGFDRLAFGIGLVDIVHANAAADDELEIGGAVDELLGAFGLAADQDDIGLGDQVLVIAHLAIGGQPAGQGGVELVAQYDLHF